MKVGAWPRRNRGKLREIVPAARRAWASTLLHHRRGRARLPSCARTATRSRTTRWPRRARRRAATGLPAIADDSGLEVDALAARPASTRRATPGSRPTTRRNNAKLLEALRGVPAARRGARFRCVAAFVDPARGHRARARGDCAGEILERRAATRLRLRPAVPGSGAGPHDGGAAARREEPALSPRRRVPRAGRGAVA